MDAKEGQDQIRADICEQESARRPSAYSAGLRDQEAPSHSLQALNGIESGRALLARRHT